MSRVSRLGDLSLLYPRHFYHFNLMLGRAQKIGTDFTDDKSGFLEFVEHIGPIPANMERPTIGRKDHTKGYVRDNFEWQERRANAQEAAVRVHTGLTRSQDTRTRISESGKGKRSMAKTPWLEPELKRDLILRRVQKSWETRRLKALSQEPIQNTQEHKDCQ